MGKQAEDNKNDSRFELLRELLLEGDRDKLAETVHPLIDEKIENLRLNFPEYFGEAITKAIKVQIRDSQDEVVEALYPILGKLVKKFIVAEITKLSDNINRTIKEKLSIGSIIIRFFKGGNNNADVILQEVFEPIIEEVFVIQKDSGLLVGNFSRGNIA